MCKSSGFVEQRYNAIKAAPLLLDNNEPSIGIRNVQVENSNGWLKCSFTRSKSLEMTKNYFDLNQIFFILAAIGEYTSTNSLEIHADKTYSSSKVDFKSFSLISGVADEFPKIKYHGK